MKYKSKVLASLCLLIGLGTTFFSCDDDEVQLSNLNVWVNISDDFTGVSTENLYVYLENTLDNAIDSSLTDADGLAIFSQLAPGTYIASCTKKLSQEEASASSGYYEEITLNAVVPNVELFAGITSDLDLELNGSPSNALIIKEFYYSGANDPTWTTLFKDQFIEIYNNSSEVVYADGLYIASIVPQDNGSDDNDEVNPLLDGIHVYADKVAKIPGNGTDTPIEPGKSLVIAFNAIDWTNGGAYEYSVDLSDADFELYAIDWLESLGRVGNEWIDTDTEADNMEMIYLNIANYGYFTFQPGGASVALLKMDQDPTDADVVQDPTSSASNPIYWMQLNAADIVDGIDMLFDAESGDFKRLPTSVDAGFNYVTGNSYTSTSLLRKEAKTTSDGRIIYKDTNNSSEDFQTVHVYTREVVE